MKIIKRSEFNKIDKPTIFGEYIKSPNERYTSLMLEFIKLGNGKENVGQSLLDGYIDILAGTKPYETVTEIRKETFDRPYKPVVKELEGNNDVMVFDDKDVEHLLETLMTAFPEQATNVAYRLGIARQHEDLD